VGALSALRLPVWGVKRALSLLDALPEVWTGEVRYRCRSSLLSLLDKLRLLVQAHLESAAGSAGLPGTLRRIVRVLQPR
jgi:hypothetical protein